MTSVESLEEWDGANRPQPLLTHQARKSRPCTQSRQVAIGRQGKAGEPDTRMAFERLERRHRPEQRQVARRRQSGQRVERRDLAKRQAYVFHAAEQLDAVERAERRPG